MFQTQQLKLRPHKNAQPNRWIVDRTHFIVFFPFVTGGRRLPTRAQPIAEESAQFRDGRHLVRSGLDVVRYDADSLHGEFDARFHLIESATELHQTPFGTTQQFLYCFCKVE